MLRRVCVMVLILLVTSCGGGEEEYPEPIGVVGAVVVESGNQVQGAYQYVIDLNNQLVAVVNQQVIEPYIADNPFLPESFEVGFQPKYIPLRLAVDSDGNVLISSSATIVTDIGAFDVETSKTVISQETDPLLIIQIDDQVAVYKLPPPGSNQFYEVNFSDTYDHYRVNSFRQERNGNIVLKLETIE